jgi:hypothetical protein
MPPSHELRAKPFHDRHFQYAVDNQRHFFALVVVRRMRLTVGCKRRFVAGKGASVNRLALHERRYSRISVRRTGESAKTWAPERRCSCACPCCAAASCKPAISAGSAAAKSLRDKFIAFLLSSISPETEINASELRKYLACPAHNSHFKTESRFCPILKFQCNRSDAKSLSKITLHAGRMHPYPHETTMRRSRTPISERCCSVCAANRALDSGSHNFRLQYGIY